VSRGVSRGQTQQASVMLSSTTQTCCGLNNNVTCEVSIWEDMVYRTFAFVPQPESCQSSLIGSTSAAAATPPAVAAARSALRMPVLAASFAGPPLSGTVMRAGTPARGETVVISDQSGKVLYRIATDHLGRYFSGAIPPGSVRVQVGRRTLQTTIRAGQQKDLNFKL
jgi:hypothetical protein